MKEKSLVRGKKNPLPKIGKGFGKIVGTNPS
jgi:hypothetical protein